MKMQERTGLLEQAGLARFAQKTDHFLYLLREALPSEPFSAYDTCLIPALAEALGYGRDRAFFRAAGLHLVGVAGGGDLPEPQGRAPSPSPLDARRLRALGDLVEQWKIEGAWKKIRRSLNATIQPAAVVHTDDLKLCHSERVSRSPERSEGEASIHIIDHQSLIRSLRAIFSGISTARTDIVICNVILPFTAAVSLLEDDPSLYTQTRQVYLVYPGLASNQVTRSMCKQLRLDHEPDRACQQQGLHHIYAQTCREKRCEECLVTLWERNR
jgi:hypothetical protein